MKKVNCCDGIYNSLDVHFTSLCDNKCGHCIDLKYDGVGIPKPDVHAIYNTIKENAEGVDDVLFLGGEPCLFLKELLECIKLIQTNTHLKVFVTTSIPKTCYDQKDLFYELIDLVDGINLSVQHHNEQIADQIRRTKSRYDRQKFYWELPNKNKIRINLNIVKPFLFTKEDITACLSHYDKMGFNSIKLSEIQHGKACFVSFEKVFGIRMKSPYSHGCQTYLNMEDTIEGFQAPLLLKRSCFACEETLKPSVSDGIKVVGKLFSFSSNKYGIVYEDGTLMKGWV
ncbi:radical SAM protein [archaeon]|nr:radical SAM protein [archaeon]